MNAQTHNAALRAAAKVAFSVTLSSSLFTVLGGCGGSVTDPAAGTSATDPSNGQKSESSYTGGGSGSASPSGTGTGSAAPSSTSTPTKPAPTAIKDAGTPPKTNCDTVLASAFADAGWIDPNTVSPDVRDCCIAELKDEVAKLDGGFGMGPGSLGDNGFKCCEATHWGQDTNDQKVQMACTPWGPPVPPVMPARLRDRIRNRNQNLLLA